MRSSFRSSASAAVIGLLAGIVLASAAAAQGSAGEGKGSWTVRGFGAWIDTAGETMRSQSIDPLPPVIDAGFTLGDGSGAGLALEYRVSRRFGVEALAIFADLDGEYRLSVSDPIEFEGVHTRNIGTEILGLGLNFHLTPGRPIDLYLGPLVALGRYGDFRSGLAGFTFTADFEDDTAFGFTLGADVALGRSGRWAVTAALRQLRSSAERSESGTKIDVDPFIVSAGLGYRWGGR